MAKKTEAEKVLAAIPEGGYAVSPSGGTKIVRGSDEDAGGFRWISGKDEKPLGEDQVIKNLMRLKSEVLATWKIVGPEEAAEDQRERAAADEKVRERVGLNKVAEAKKNGSTSRRSSAKAKPEVEMPKGFSLATGEEAAVGDQIVTDAEQGPERIVSIGSGGKSRGRTYLKLMLEPPTGRFGSGEARRRFISPRKEYPLKPATKADRSGATAEKLAAEKSKPKAEAKAS